MSVPKAKRKHEASPIVMQSRELYEFMVKLCGDQDICDRVYRPCVIKSITNQAQAIAHCIAAADAMNLFGKNARANARRIYQFQCVDGLQMLITDIYVLFSIGRLSQERLVQSLTKIVELDRALRVWIQEDMHVYDKLLKCKQPTEIGYDDHLEDVDSAVVPFPESVTLKNKDSFKNAFKEALKNVKKHNGIVNNPTGPDSPVKDEVYARQKVTKDNASLEDINKAVELQLKENE